MKIAALQAKHAADAQRAQDQRVQQEQRANDQRAAQQFKLMQPPRGQSLRHDDVLPRDVRADRDLALGAPRSCVVELSGEAAAVTASAPPSIVLIALAMVCGVLVMLHQGAH